MTKPPNIIETSTIRQFWRSIVADTAEEVDMPPKFTFFFTIISRSFSIENSMVDR